jgi:hypothetical protein
MSLRTKTQKEREVKHKKIRKVYQELSADPSNAKTAIEQKIMDKFGIKARSTVWNIVSQPSESLSGNLNPRL